MHSRQSYNWKHSRFLFIAATDETASLETGIATAAAFARQEQGAQADEAPSRFVTGSLKVGFKRPTPLGVELVLEGKLRSIEGRKVQVDVQLLANGEVCVTGELLAIQLKA